MRIGVHGIGDRKEEHCGIQMPTQFFKTN
jgi:hypothetical protein